MKFLVLALCVCAASAATIPSQVVQATASVATAPYVAAKTVYEAGKEVNAEILRQESDVHPEGFDTIYETSNGIVSQAHGTLKKVEDTVALVQEGSYRYIAADGTPVEVTYVADETGFHPNSNVLPVAPPVPAEIARSLEFIARSAQEVKRA